MTHWTPEELADMEQFDAEIEASNKPHISIKLPSSSKEYHKAYNREYYLSRQDELIDKAKENNKKTAQLVRQSSGVQGN